MKKDLFGGRSLVASLVMAAMVASTFALEVDTAKAAPDSTLYFAEVGVPGTPVTTDTVVMGDDISFDAAINPGTNQVSGAELHVTFDPTKFSLTSITPPTAPSDCTATPAFSTVLQGASINNTSGTGSIILGVCMATPAAPVVTSSTVATFVFHALATATASSISFTTASQASAVNETEDVITTRTPVAVTVTSDPTDTTAPTLSNGSPSGALAAGTTQTTVSLSTNEAATCKFSQTAGTAYARMTGTFTTTGSTSHSMTAAGLTNGTSYNYYVRCSDTSDNVTTSDYAISFSVSSAVVASSDDDDDDGDSHKKEKEKKKKRKITNSKSKVSRGQVLTQRGKRFSKKSIVLLYFSKPGGGYYTPMKIMTSASGAFVTTYKVNKPTGKYSWYAVDQKTGKKSKVVTYTVR